MPTPYVYERQVEYWTSRAIENFFLDAGFEVLVFPLTQLSERQVPSDFLYLNTETNKIFGLQYKALYRNGADHWNLEPYQHKRLASFRWMYYGLSDLKAPRQHRNALHYLRVAAPSFTFHPKLSARNGQDDSLQFYWRWAAFFEGLCDCRYGHQIGNSHDLQQALWPDQAQPAPREIVSLADEVFVTNLDRRRAVRYSSLLAPQRQG